MAETISENLENVAKGPKTVETDGLRVTQHTPREIIEAEQHETRAANAKKSALPFRVTKFAGRGPAY